MVGIHGMEMKVVGLLGWNRLVFGLSLDEVTTLLL
jgi:hypothetical protein